MILNMISGPRNISTALMYSWGQRRDTKAIDEPFYGYYLKNFEVDHPGANKVLETMDDEVESIVLGIERQAGDSDILFLKNMGHHLIIDEPTFLLKWTNMFLIRNPRQLIASLAKIIEEPGIRDIGLEQQYVLFNWLRDKTGRIPLVVDSGEVLKNPELVLSRWCEKLDISFDNKMLNWKPGPKKEDGLWAPWWYKNVHRTTGFSKQKTSTRPLPEKMLPLYEEARPYYETLYSYAIKAN